MNIYDKDALYERTDVMDVLDYLGTRYYKRGGCFFLYCPDSNHNDKHPTNCFFKSGDKNVYCTACNKSFSSINLIMIKTGCSYTEALEKLWELNGCDESLIKRISKTTSKKERAKHLYLTNEEKKFLGLHIPQKIAYPVEYSSDKKYLTKDMPKGYRVNDKDIGYLYEKFDNISLYDLIDEATFRQLVVNKIWERMANFTLLTGSDKVLIVNLFCKIMNLRKESY